MCEPSTSKPKALALISGGLDSQLAARIIMEQGIEVIGIKFRTDFTNEGSKNLLQNIHSDLGIEVISHSVNDSDYLAIIKSPCYGYGSAINPCLDCRILFLREAKAFMEDISADFVVTGEVLGQRPMTQRRQTMELIKEKSTLGDKLLRPLSAKLLNPTSPELEGLVEREKLLDIQGRSRKRQLKLAKTYGIKNYSQPAGGCLLTEEAFGKRVRDLFEHKGREETTINDLKTLKYGRHFRLPGKGKAIIGRNEEENKKLKEFCSSYWALRTSNIAGPLTLISKDISEKDLVIGAKLTARYSQGRKKDHLEVLIERENSSGSIEVEPLDTDSDLIEELRVHG